MSFGRKHVRAYLTSTAAMSIGLIAHSVGLIIVARALGAEQFGIFTLITTGANFGLVWCGLGGGEVLRRMVARDRNAYAEASGHAILLLVVTGLALSLAVALIEIFFVSIAPNAIENFLLVFIIAFANIALFSWIGLCEQILLAQDNLTGANLINMGAGAGRAIASAVACLGFGVTTLKSYAIWHFGFYVVVSLAALAAILPFGRPRFGILRDEVLRGSTMSVSGLFAVLRQNADTLALGAIASPATVGTYAVARRIIGTASVVTGSMDRLVYSSFARAGAQGATATLKLALRYAGYAFGLCAVTSTALILAAPFIPAIFGSSYSDAVGLVQILSWTLILTSLQFLASDALNASELHTARLAAETYAGLLGVGMLIVLAYAFGLTGILAATYAVNALVAASLWGMLYMQARKSRTMPMVEPQLSTS